MAFTLVFILFVLIVIALGLPRLITAFNAAPRLFSLDEAPSRPVAIVFGAGLWRDGSPTPVLRDRVATAANLYFSGKVEKLLMTGDNRFVNYNEPASMRAYAMELGVPDQAIVLDFAGRRTYDSCYRARDIFGVRQAILVTQSFHLPRAIFLCGSMGISAIGVPADLRQYRRSSLFYWNLRELPATLTALWEAWITHPQPVLGKPEPIFPPEVAH
jgi:SanA protein